ncbi:glycosyltransferase family 4 protein [Caulobacter sp. FWC2]|uniref:glycosyltransferase family 4 protein n=1 Tax=Caulobacter sp. FWC2 TaxID=69664 RepID=UPI000C159A04|nr:glycosyltransferase family 4 protein [Caulobacter sp. FWC2]PIB92151.1 hypothetical protein CSW62_11565 [Caulobacter sp. FWC2]
MSASPALRVAIVVSHPIQYFAPLYRALAATPQLQLLVLFSSRIGLDHHLDPAMGVAMAWKTDLTSGYPHRFLAGAEGIAHAGFLALNNVDVGRRLAEHDPDVVILHGYASLTNLKALAWAKLRRRPVILASDASIDAAGLAPRVVKRRLLALFSAFLTLGDRAEAFLAARGAPRERLFRAPAMLDEGFWRVRDAGPAHRALARKRLGLADGDTAVLCVGKLYAGKRVGDVIAALARLPDPPILIVAGDGAERATLEAQAVRAGVGARFLGFVNIDALPDVYAAADALIHAAELEQYGMVLLEAAVLGLPLVVSDRVGAVGATAIAQPDRNALVFSCGDIAALAAAIDKVRDPRTAARLGEASLAISQAHRGPATVAAVMAACLAVKT